MQRIIFIVLVSFLTLTAQNKPLAENLKRSNYKAAFNKCMDMKNNARSRKDQFYWRYYFLRIALIWDNENEFNRSGITYEDFQKIFKEFDKMKVDDAKKTEIKNLYHRYFYPLKIYIKSKKEETAELNQNTIGKFGFRIVNANDKDVRPYLTPLQLLRINQLDNNNRINNKLKEIEFKPVKTNKKYLAYNLPDVPLLQADNQNLGYMIQYTFINKEGKKQTEEIKRIATFSKGTKKNRRIAILENGIDQANLGIKYPPGLIDLRFKNGIPNIKVDNAKVLNNYKKDGYLRLEVAPKERVIVELINNQKKEDESAVWPIAIAIIGGISFILAR
jgi:hypothetical protein